MTTVVKDFIIENKNPESSILHGLNYDVTYDFKYDLSDHSPSDWNTHGNIKVIDIIFIFLFPNHKIYLIIILITMTRIPKTIKKI